jgi:hypothetical protein
MLATTCAQWRYRGLRRFGLSESSPVNCCFLSDFSEKTLPDD